MGIITTLEGEIATKKAELSEKLGYMHKDSQEITNLQRRIESLEEQVKELRAKLATNAKNNNTEAQVSMSKSVAEYENLELEHEFALKLLQSSLTGLEMVRQQSLAKTKYLIRIDEPKVPDESLWPRPFKAAIIVLIISFFMMLGISLIISAVMEHLGI